MALKIRLSRGGTKKRPFYRLVIADARAPRDGRFIERVGTYNPMLPKDDENRVTLVTDRIKHWLGNGALPTPRVAIFLGKAGIIDMPAQRNNPNKGKPSERTLERNREKEAKIKAAEEAAAEALAAEKTAKAEAVAAPAAPAEEVKEAKEA